MMPSINHRIRPNQSISPKEEDSVSLPTSGDELPLLGDNQQNPTMLGGQNWHDRRGFAGAQTQYATTLPKQQNGINDSHMKIVPLTPALKLTSLFDATEQPFENCLPSNQQKFANFDTFDIQDTDPMEGIYF